MIGILRLTLPARQWTSHRSRDLLLLSEKLTMDSYRRASSRLLYTRNEEREHPMVPRNTHQSLVAMPHPTLIKEGQQVIHPKVQVEDQALWLKTVTQVATKILEANLPATKKNEKILRWFVSSSAPRTKTWVVNKLTTKWVKVLVLKTLQLCNDLTQVRKSMAVLKMHMVAV